MQKNAALYDYTQTVQGVIFQAAVQQYSDGLRSEEDDNLPAAPALFQIRQGYAESPGWIMVQMQEFDPQPLTVELFRRRAVYTAPRLAMAMLELLMSEGWLDRRGDAYALTDAGRAIQARRTQTFRAYFESFQPVNDADMQGLATLTARIIDASLSAASPPGSWCLSYSRRRAPGTSASWAEKLIQYFSDFNAFRDDAHMAAYNAHNIPGYTWEAFSFVHNEKAQSAETLFEQLHYRGWTRDEWQMMLDDLVRRDLLMQQEAGYQVTESGRSVYADVEVRTDRYFFAPWDVLTAKEYDELIALMEAIRTACQALL